MWPFSRRSEARLLKGVIQRLDWLLEQGDEMSAAMDELNAAVAEIGVAVNKGIAAIEALATRPGEDAAGLAAAAASLREGAGRLTAAADAAVPPVP